MLGLASEEDEVHFISNQGSNIFGTALVRGSSVSGTFDAIAPPNYIFPDGSTDGEVQVNATIKEKISFNGTYKGLGDNGSFNLTYNTLYDRDSLLSLLAGQWLLSTINSVPVNILLTIQNDGTVTGNSLSGNTYNGNVVIIDPDYNMYQVSIYVSDINNNVNLYTGLCALGDWMVINDILYFGVHSSNIIAIAGTFVKQFVKPFLKQRTFSETYYTVVDADGQTALAIEDGILIDETVATGYRNLGLNGSRLADSIGGDLGSTQSVSTVRMYGDREDWSNFKVLYNIANNAYGWTEVTNLTVTKYKESGGLGGKYTNELSFDTVYARWWKVWASPADSTGVLSVYEFEVYGE